MRRIPAEGVEDAVKLDVAGRGDHVADGALVVRERPKQFTTNLLVSQDLIDRCAVEVPVGEHGAGAEYDAGEGGSAGPKTTAMAGGPSSTTRGCSTPARPLWAFEPRALPGRFSLRPCPAAPHGDGASSSFCSP